MYSRHRGMTLIEFVFVMAIASMVLVLGFRFYQTYNDQTQIEQVRFNVNELFQAMNHYYQANCQTFYDPSGAPIANTGKLDPATFSGSTVSLTYPALITAGFLPANWPRNPVSALVDNSGQAGYSGYFLKNTSDKQQISVCWNFTGNQSDVICQAPQDLYQPRQSTLIVWVALVAVKVADTAKIEAMKNILGADCVSGANNKCDGGTGPYLIWQKLPLSNSTETISTLWPSLPILKQFNMQYTHDQLYEFQNQSTPVVKNYLCGG